MKNPYKILNLKQDATNTEIVKAMAPALRARKYNQREITEAQTMLRKPATRLAADFTFPVLDEEKVIPLASSIKSKDINLEALDPNKYNSLK